MRQSGASEHSARPELGTDDQQHASCIRPAQLAEKRPAIANEKDGVNTDGRAQLDWRSKYDAEAVKQIRFDAAYIALLLIFALTAIFLTWRGTTYMLMTGGCKTCSQATFNKYSYFFLGGFLGGVLFAVKYLYKVVARQ